MISTQGLAGELSDAGKLFGLLHDDGNLNEDWFAHPFDNLESILGNPSQRAALLRLLDALLPPAQLNGIPDNEHWHPVLGDKPQGNVYVTTRDTGSSVVFGMGGEFGGDVAKLRAQVSLVSANTGVHALAGPLRVQLRIQLGFHQPAQAIGLDAISATASISPTDVNVAVKLEKLVLKNDPPRDVILDPSNLGPEATQMVLGLVQQILHDATPAAGTEAEAVAKHLLPLLGLGDPDIPPFPLTNLAGLQNWLRALPFNKWLPHLAGLMGISAAPFSGSGTIADPWVVQLVPFNPQSALSFTVANDSGTLLIGLRAQLKGGAGDVQAQANLASIPLNGTAAATVLPSASFLFINSPGAIATTLRAGLTWNGTSLQPLLELLDATIVGTHYDRIDLTNTEAVASAGIKAAILAALGAGPGQNFAALAALIAPTADPTSTHLVDFAALIANPARAIAKAHREILLDAGAHNWSAMLAELASLLGIPGAVTGSGKRSDPWQIPFGPPSFFQVSLAAWNNQTSGNPTDPQQLRIGLQAAVSSPPTKFFWLAELLAIDLPASGAGSASLMAGQHLSVLVQPGPSTPPFSGFSLSAESFEADMDWSPGSSMQWHAALNNFKVTSASTTVTLASLRFPIPAGFDSSNPAAAAAALGISVPNLELLLRLMLTKAAISWGQMPGYVLAGLVGVNSSLSGFQADWPPLTGFLPDPIPALRTWLGHLAVDVSASATPFLPVGLNWLDSLLSGTVPSGPGSKFTISPLNGLGTYEEPWTLSLSGSQTADALVWLEPAGPPSTWAAGIGARIAAATTFLSFIDGTQELAPFLPEIADGFRDIDTNILANALSQLAFFLTTSDGVVPLTSQQPTGDTWTQGTLISAVHTKQPQDASAIAQIKAQVDTLAGGPASPRVVLLLGPQFSDHTIWTTFIAGAPTANFDLRNNLPDPTTAVNLYTADLSAASDPIAQIARIVTRIGTLNPGLQVTLVAHSTAGVPARAFTAANPTLIKGLITLGTPHTGSDLPFLTDPGVIQAVRLIQSLRASMDPSPIRDAIDHMIFALDGYLPPPSAGALPVPAPYPVADFVGSQVTSTGGKPAFALGGTAPGDLIAEIKKAAAALAATAAAAARPAPTHIAFGLQAHLPFPAANDGELSADATLRSNLFRLKLNNAAAEPARPAQSLGVRLDLRRPGDWLTPHVRTAELGVDLATKATPYLILHQAAYRAPLVSRMTLADVSAQALLGEVMQAISNPAPAVSSSSGALLAALQSIGIAVPDPHGGIGLSADAFASITTDVVSFFKPRLAAALADNIAGLGTPLEIGGLPIEVAVTPTSLAIRTAPDIPLGGLAALAFDSQKMSGSFSIGSMTFTYASGKFSFAAPPWLGNVPLPPDPATLKSVLDDALPRMLFNAAAGAVLEALMGPGFLVQAIDQFFSHSGDSASNSSGTGDGNGALSGFKLNKILQALNKIAGFPAGPGLTLPAGLQLVASGSTPAVLALSTTAPIGGILGFALTASIDKLRHVEPGGTITLTTPKVAVTFGADLATGLSLSVNITGVGVIQILPTFSGFGALAGAGAALLPQALDAIVAALPPAPWLTNALAVATAIGIYDAAGHFSAHTPELRALIAGNWLALFDPSKRASVATAAAGFLNSLGGIPGTISAAGPAVNWSFALAGADSGTVGLSLGWDGSGPLATLSTSNLKLGAGAIAINLNAGYAAGTLQAHTDWSVPILSALNINLSPKLDVSVLGGNFQVKLLPLATSGVDGPLTINLAPTVSVQLTSPAQLINSLLIPLATDVAYQAMKPHLPDVLWAGKTVKDLLVAAKIITPAEVLTTPVPDVLTMVAGLLTGLPGLEVDLTPTLKLRLISDGSRAGIALQGLEEFTAGNYVISALFGAPKDWEAGVDEGIALKLIDTAGSFSINPGLTVAGLGIGISGAGDAALIDLAGFRLGGFRGYFFFDAEFKSGPLFSNFGAGVELDKLGLPLGLATGGNVGGDNPVAASLLRSDGGNSGDTHPVNPAIDIEAWSWKTGFHIKFGGQTGTLWIGVHRSFGPIHIDQVGLEVGGKSVALLIDGSVKVAGLTAQAHELGIVVPYNAIASPGQWSLDLKGLAIGFQAPGVTIAGAFVKSDGPPVEYDGMLLIQITQFGFIAVGAYSTPTDPSTHDTYTSLFVFAGVFIDIGLPPIIEISGLGLGIGYNRELIVPTDLEKIPTFLLVEALDNPGKIADDPMGALLTIRDSIPARRGSFWLAAGLRGTSFVVVHVTAIIYVALDRGFEIGILGVARMALPSDDTALVSVELALKVRFSTAESLFSIQAQLTSNSYLLNKDCQLTGGFAYFMWFAKAQFLLTMGGYNPAFHREPEYPDVPRLGYHWSFLGIISIKGESYFALTNTCVMAGTRFEATYGPDWLQLWFTAYADFLVSWDPFYYDFDIGVAIGARFHMRIDLFFGTIDIEISVSLGASLHVAGPPFHGTVTVDLAIASVTVAFGPDPQQNKTPLPWTVFVSKYLHADEPGNEAALMHALTGLLPPDPAGGQPSPGTAVQPWKMASEWSFQSETRMPAMDFIFQTADLRAEGEWGTKVFGAYRNLSSIYKFDIAPIGKDQAHHKLLVTHAVQIVAFDDQTNTWVTMAPIGSIGAPNDDRFLLDSARFRLEPVISQVSEATYHLLPHDNIPAAARTLPALTGMKITGVAILRNESAVIPISKLFDAGSPRPLPFATLTVVLIDLLKQFGATAEALGLLSATASSSVTTSAAATILTGNRFFDLARSATGIDPAGLHPLATRALSGYRSAPPLLTPITTGLTMKPVGQPAPPVITRPGPVDVVPLTAPRLRAVVQGRPAPTIDAPAVIRTTVGNTLANISSRSTTGSTVNIPRLAAPKLQVVPGARLLFIRSATAPSPTRAARGTRTIRAFQLGWSLSPAHRQAFTAAEDRISGNGVIVPSGTTHIWDVPMVPRHAVQVAGPSVGRVTCLTQYGLPIDDRELTEGRIVLPDGCAMVAVSCLGQISQGIAGWQTGNLMQQIGSMSLLGRRCLIVLPQAATTTKLKQPTAQAMVRMSDAMANQPGVETWLPTGTDVAAILLDVEDLCATADWDLALGITGAELTTPPVRVAGGRRKMLLYDVVKRDPQATHIIVSAASKAGARMAGVLGLSGTAQEWGLRFNGSVPEHLVPDGPSTPDGKINVTISEERTNG